jgi:hypothetical protein
VTTLRCVTVPLIFKGALGARMLGGHYANDNCCSKKENGSGGRS